MKRNHLLWHADSCCSHFLEGWHISHCMVMQTLNRTFIVFDFARNSSSFWLTMRNLLLISTLVYYTHHYWYWNIIFYLQISPVLATRHDIATILKLENLAENGVCKPPFVPFQICRVGEEVKYVELKPSFFNTFLFSSPPRDRRLFFLAQIVQQSLYPSWSKSNTSRPIWAHFCSTFFCCLWARMLLN